MNLTLEKVNQDNIRACVKLEVAELQKDFIAKNVNTIAWAYVDPNFTPYAILDGETVIGLLAIEDVPENEDYDRYWIPRFMIGEQFQGKGYGKQAMHAAIDLLSAKPDCQRIRLSVWPENPGAIEFYQKVGFTLTDELLEDELVMDYYIQQP